MNHHVNEWGLAASPIGGSCSSNTDCASGVCQNGQCIMPATTSDAVFGGVAGLVIGGLGGAMVGHPVLGAAGGAAVGAIAGYAYAKK